MVIDSDKQHLPACPAAAVTAIAGSAMSGCFDAPELLGVDVDQVTRPLVFVALNRLGRGQVGQTCQAGTSKYPTHSRL